MNKRDIVLSVLDQNQKPQIVPAAFFLHFDPQYHRGLPAVEKHLEYFRYTGMDFVKIQYENSFPLLPQIQKPEDWVNMPLYKEDFYAEPLRVVEGLVKSARREALVILTLYSPFMSAVHTSSAEMLTLHIMENPEPVKRGMEIITASLMGFVKKCIQLGIDGFYTSTQGGEAGRFTDASSFNECVKPYDLALMEEINRSCIFNILHICDYQRPYDDLTRFLGYPGHVVNCSLEMVNGNTSAKEVARMFNRPYMGGLNRKGAILTGSPDEIRQEVKTVLRDAPERFILGADCTIPSSVNWDNLRTAIDTAHTYHQ